MEANRSRMRWTYAEFARLPSERGMRHEVIDGELVVTPAPGLRHQRVVTELAVLSPSTAARDRGIKLDRYRHFDVPEYWVVDPDARSIEVWDLAAGAAEPAVLGPDDTLRWDPAGSTRALEIPVGDVVAEG